MYRGGQGLLGVVIVGFCFHSVSTVQAADIPPQPVGGKINWVYSYAEGQKLARESGKPLLVVFRCER